MFDFKELIFQMRRRILTNRPSMNAPTGVPINWETLKHCVHDIYLNKITKYDSLIEVVYPEGTNQSNFSLDMSDYLINLKRKIDFASSKTLKMNISKKDSTHKFGISLILIKDAGSDIIDAKLRFACEMEDSQTEEFEVSIGIFDLATYDNQFNILVGEQTFDNKNPNMLKPWVTIDFKSTSKIIFNNMPINIRNFFDMNTNEFIIKDYNLI